MAIEQENGDRNIYAGATVFNKTADAATAGAWELDIRVGDGTKNLHTNAATLTLTVTVAGETIGGGAASVAKDAGTLRARLSALRFHVANGEAVTAVLSSNNSNDTDVDVTVTPERSVEVLACGLAKASLESIMGTALSETSVGYLAAAFKKLFDVASPVLTAASVDQTIDAGSSAHYQAVANTITGRRIWHVAKTGNDANDGKTLATAKLTIAGAVAVCGQGDEIVVWPNATAYSEAVDLSNLTGVTLRVMRGATISNAFTPLKLGNCCEGTGEGTLICTDISSFAPCVSANQKLNPTVSNLQLVSGSDGVHFVNCTGSCILENTRIQASEYGVYSAGSSSRTIIRNNSFLLSEWTSCACAGIAGEAGELLVVNNIIEASVPGAITGNPVMGIYGYAGAVITSVGNKIKAVSSGVAEARGVFAETGGDVIYSANDSIETISSGGGAYDLCASGASVGGMVYVAGSRYATSMTYYNGKIIDLDERAAQNIIEDNNLDHWQKVPTGSADMTNEVVDGTVCSRIIAAGDTSAFVPATHNLLTLAARLTGVTSLAAWLRGLFRKDTMNATAKSEVNDTGGTFNEATDSLEAQQEYAVTVKADTAAAKTAAEAVNTSLADEGEIYEAIDQIAADVAGLDGEAMRGTDGANTTAPPSAATIAAATAAALAETISQIDTLYGSLAEEAGEIQYIECKDTDGEPLAGVEVRITSDLAGTAMIRIPKYTLSDGKVAFRLAAGTYYVWRYILGREATWDNPEAITVTE